MTEEELAQMDLRVCDRVYIAEAGTGDLSVGDIVNVAGVVNVAGLKMRRPYGAGVLLSDSCRRFCRLARVGEGLAGLTTRIIFADGTLSEEARRDGIQLFYSPLRVIVAYPDPPESPEQAAKREALEELSKAREALAAAEAKVEALA